MEKKNEEGIANRCLMANANEVNPENSSVFTFDELYEAFNELMDDFRKLRLKNKEFKQSNLLLDNEKSKLLTEKEDILKDKKYSQRKGRFFETN